MKPRRIDRLIGKIRIPTSSHLDERISDLVSRPHSMARHRGVGKILMESRITKPVIAAAIMIALLIVIGRFGPDMGSTAFAEVCQNVIKSETVSLVLRASMQGEPAVYIYEKDGHLMRSEFTDGFPFKPGINVILSNSLSGDYLELDTENKVGQYFTGNLNSDRSPAPSLYETFKNFLGLPDYTVKELEERKIGGRMTKGYKLSGSQETSSVWVDISTNLPIQIEIEGTARDGESSRQVWTDIVFGQPLDDALFDFKPAGYEIKTFDRTKGMQHMSSAVMMNNILKACRRYVNDNQGQWPGKLEELLAYDLPPDAIEKPIKTCIYLKPSGPVTETTIILYEAYDQWQEGINVGYANGQVYFLKDESEFKKLLLSD